MNELSLTICSVGLVVLGYGIRLLQEAFREYMEGMDER